MLPEHGYHVELRGSVMDTVQMPEPRSMHQAMPPIRKERHCQIVDAEPRRELQDSVRW
jgi:hypothetical protein